MAEAKGRSIRGLIMHPEQLLGRARAGARRRGVARAALPLCRPTAAGEGKGLKEPVRKYWRRLKFENRQSGTGSAIIRLVVTRQGSIWPQIDEFEGYDGQKRYL